MTQSTPSVSVLMTSYNREKYIAAAIESVLVQTYRDFELLVVDNRSSDQSVAIARGYAERDPRVKVLVNERNLGQFGNRNRAATHAMGRFLKYHDSDDLMYPHCLATMVRLLEEEPRAGFAATSGWSWPGGPCPMLSTPVQSYEREFLGFGMFFMGPSCALFRREMLEALGGFEEHGVASDNVFWLKACARYSAVLVPGDLFWYRRHPDQELVSEGAEREYSLGRAEVWKALHREECPLEGSKLAQARRNWAYAVARGVYRRLKAGRFRAAYAMARLSELTLRDWLRYLRPQRRDTFAGTGYEQGTDWPAPRWMRLEDRAPV